jgi:hypothetical protein
MPRLAKRRNFGNHRLLCREIIVVLRDAEGGASMGTFGILVLDKNDTGREGIWYVTASAARPDDLKRLTTHDDTIVMQLSKSLYSVTFISLISLRNTHTGTMDAGKIYEVHHV